MASSVFPSVFCAWPFEVKVLKLYGWEMSFVKRIDEIRDEEVYQLKIFQFLEASQFFAWTAAPLLVALGQFLIEQKYF